MGARAAVTDDVGSASVSFAPPGWLRHPHVQSVLPSLPFRRPGVERRSRDLLRNSSELIVDCGDGVRLLARHARPERAGTRTAQRLAVLLHGWVGMRDVVRDYVRRLWLRLLLLSLIGLLLTGCGLWALHILLPVTR